MFSIMWQDIGEATQQFIAPSEGLGEDTNDLAASSKLVPTKPGSGNDESILTCYPLDLCYLFLH